MDINELLSGRFMLSLLICITALLFSYAIAIPVGIISATTKYKSLDNALKFISYLLKIKLKLLENYLIKFYQFLSFYSPAY